MARSNKKSFFYICSLGKIKNEFLFTLSDLALSQVEQFMVSKEPLGFGSYLTTWLSPREKEKHFGDKHITVHHANDISEIINLAR